MLLEAIGAMAYAGLLGAFSKYTVDKALELPLRQISLRHAAARAIQRAFRTHLQKFWWWQVASVREEARIRSVSARDVLRHITMPFKRAESAKKIQAWFRANAGSTMVSDAYSDSCNDDSSFDVDDSEESFAKDFAAAAEERLIATRVDPLSPIGKEGLRIILSRLDGGTGTEEVDAASIMKEALLKQTLFVGLRAAGAFRVFSGLQLVNCKGPGLEILGCGSIRRSGGGRAVFQAAVSYARHHDIPFLILRPLWSETGEARSFWRHYEFVEYEELQGLWLHRKHPKCRCYAKLRRQVVGRISAGCTRYSLEPDEVINVLLTKTTLATLPMLLWL